MVISSSARSSSQVPGETRRFGPEHERGHITQTIAQSCFRQFRLNEDVLLGPEEC